MSTYIILMAQRGPTPGSTPGAGSKSPSPKSTYPNATPVARLDPTRRARREVRQLLAAAAVDLAAAQAGDLARVFDAHAALSRAVVLVLDHRLDLGGWAA